ncbi:MAG TPA: aldo/keto reductase, partial [Kofleriaceae bacterium]|nr:aldo/keto reductase [Kofleriaceae bacterium]
MIGLGCMRLSTDASRDDARSLAVLRVALDEGITLFDTADAYALDDLDIGHNEKLLARALAEELRAHVGTSRVGTDGRAHVGTSLVATDGRAHVGTSLVATEGRAHGGPPVVVTKGRAHGGTPVVVTKGGLVRPDGAWVPKGNARHLGLAARSSRERLASRDATGAEGASGATSGNESAAPIDLYLLHVVDPRVPLATSVRALAKLRDDGIVRAIGLSNVTQHQLEQALALTQIEAIEVELGPHKLDAFHSGLVDFCRQRDIRVLAHRPLGGPNGVKRLARDKRLAQLCENANWSDRPSDAPEHSPDAEHSASASVQWPTIHELVLAWLAAKDVVPIPGATRVETVRSIARANRLQLSEELVRELDAHLLDEPSTTR